MVNRSCTTCVYAYWDPGHWLASLSTGFVSRPLCANHPDTPGLMKPVPFAGPCRNYRPKPPEPDKNAKRIPLGDGLYAYVDAADYEWLSKYRWFVCAHSGTIYAARRNGRGKVILMHREIMKAPKGTLIDHVNGNGVDNCQSNLRFCTRQQNASNEAKARGCSSRFKGVYREKRRNKWHAGIKFHGKHLHLGVFDDEIDAARAYDRAAVELFGEFARPNFPEEWPPERRQEVYTKRRPAGDKEGETDTAKG